MPTANSSVSVSVRDVTKTYGAISVLQDINLDVASGSFTTLLGPSGSGKTTLLMVLAGFVRPDRGGLLFNDRNVILEPPNKRNIGVVFQSYALFPHLDVFHNIAYPLRVRGVAPDEVKRRVDKALSMVQLQSLGARHIHQISGGQRQRVALARAMVFEPRVLLMDEPLSALDKSLREEMQLEIKRLHTEWATTTICVTHDQREALTMSDHVAVMDGGRIIQIDTPRNIYNRPATAFVAGFVGETSFLTAAKSGTSLSYGGRLFKTPPGVSVPDSPILVVRPERLQILGQGEGANLNILEGTVISFSYQGDSFTLDAGLPDGNRVFLRGQSRHAFLESAPLSGQPVRLGLAPADTIVVGGTA